MRSQKSTLQRRPHEHEHGIEPSRSAAIGGAFERIRHDLALRLGQLGSVLSTRASAMAPSAFSAGLR